MKRNASMTLEQLEYRLAVYGANLHRWPEEQRRDARELLDASAQAEQLYRQARGLEQVLDLWAVEPDGQALAARIIQQARHLTQEPPPVLIPRTFGLGRFLPLWPSAVALGLAFVLGLLIGLADVMSTTRPLTPLDMLAFASASAVETMAGL
jgi:hypothetical protein